MRCRDVPDQLPPAQLHAQLPSCMLNCPAACSAAQLPTQCEGRLGRHLLLLLLPPPPPLLPFHSQTARQAAGSTGLPFSLCPPSHAKLTHSCPRSHPPSRLPATPRPQATPSRSPAAWPAAPQLRRRRWLATLDGSGCGSATLACGSTPPSTSHWPGVGRGVDNGCGSAAHQAQHSAAATCCRRLACCGGSTAGSMGPARVPLHCHQTRTALLPARPLPAFAWRSCRKAAAGLMGAASPLAAA